MTKGIFVLLGGNLGEPADIFSQVKSFLGRSNVKVVKSSALYRTEAWGKKDQPAFLNQVLEISTLLEPYDLLKLILSIELQLGRERKEKWGPRIIDIDILYYGQQIINEPDLIIPHPEIQHRKFALVPLCEIAPSFIHPLYKKSQQWLLAQLKDDLIVERLN